MIQEPIDRIVTGIIAKVTRRIFWKVSHLDADTSFDDEIIFTGEYSRLHGLKKRLEDAIRAEALPEARLVLK